MKTSTITVVVDLDVMRNALIRLANELPESGYAPDQWYHDLCELAWKAGESKCSEETIKAILTIWESSRCANNALVKLALLQLAGQAPHF